MITNTIGPTLTALTLNVCIHEGPYKSGHFSFYINIPETYPFRMADVWAKQPIYHPNIDLGMTNTNNITNMYNSNNNNSLRSSYATDRMVTGINIKMSSIRCSNDAT